MGHGMEQGDECDFEFSDDVGSWIASLSNLGFLVSCLASGVLMNAVGRKWTMFIQGGQNRTKSCRN